MICIGPCIDCKTKTSSGHEKVSNKLLKSIPISHYGFILRTLNGLLIENTYPQHWKLSKMILQPKENLEMMLPCRSWPMDERQCRSFTGTIWFSWAPLNDNEIHVISATHRHWLSATNRFSRHLCGFHQGLRSTLAWRLALQIAPNELSTWTRKLHHSILEEPQVLHRNESNHLEHLRHRKGRAPKILPWADPISSLSLWNGSTIYFSHLFSSVRRWSCTDHPCLSMVASNSICIANATNRSENI